MADENPPPAALAADEVEKLVVPLRKVVAEYYDRLPAALVSDPDLQKACLTELRNAMLGLTRAPLTWEAYADARDAVTRVAGHFHRHSGAASFGVTAGLVYACVAAPVVAFALDRTFEWKLLEKMNLKDGLPLGVPVLVWGWAAVGSLTSMLLRAGQTPFPDKQEAYRWLLYRPVVGVVMGALLYLLVKTGLTVLSDAGGGSTRDEMIYVIAFLGGFSDVLSVNLLQAVIGRFQTAAPAPPPPG